MSSIVPVEESNQKDHNPDVLRPESQSTSPTEKQRRTDNQEDKNTAQRKADLDKSVEDEDDDSASNTQESTNSSSDDCNDVD